MIYLIIALGCRLKHPGGLAEWKHCADARILDDFAIHRRPTLRFLEEYYDWHGDAMCEFSTLADYNRSPIGTHIGFVRH